MKIRLRPVNNFLREDMEHLINTLMEINSNKGICDIVDDNEITSTCTETFNRFYQLQLPDNTTSFYTTSR